MGLLYAPLYPRVYPLSRYPGYLYSREAIEVLPEFRAAPAIRTRGVYASRGTRNNSGFLFGGIKALSNYPSI
jgi:hypothetical protein